MASNSDLFNKLFGSRDKQGGSSPFSSPPASQEPSRAPRPAFPAQGQGGGQPAFPSRQPVQEPEPAAAPRPAEVVEEKPSTPSFQEPEGDRTARSPESPAPARPSYRTPEREPAAQDITETNSGASATPSRVTARPTARPSATPSSRSASSSILGKSSEKMKIDDDGMEYTMQDLFRLVVEEKGSDLHMSVGSPPVIRIHGKMVRTKLPPIDREKMRHLLFGILNDEQREKLDTSWELDFSIQVPNLCRFRANIFFQKDGPAGVFRVIPTHIPTLADLHMPQILTDIARKHKGLVLVTGPTGNGKSTTLAAMIDLINNERHEHIITIEDPIEFSHNHKNCIVNQREVGQNTKSFSAALRSALREDPDIILVGELRDLETIQMALTAAETGHLVFGTLHTSSAYKTIDRVIDVFPPHQQEQIRVQLGETLQAVVAQQLIPTVSGDGRVCALEILINSSAIANLIREGKTYQIFSVLQTSKQQGMQTMDQSLKDLMKHKKISYDEALKRATDKKSFERY